MISHGEEPYTKKRRWQRTEPSEPPSLRVEGEEEEPAKGTKAWPVRWGRPRVSVSRREGARRVTWVRGGLFY